MFRDYGFVEQYPQRWIFHSQKFGFDIDNGVDGARLRVTWLDESMGQQFGCLYNVMEASIHFLGRQLARLKQVNKTKLHEPRTMPRHEFEMIVRYFEAMATAMKTAIETGLPKKDADNDNYDDDDDEEDIEDDCQAALLASKGKCVDEISDWEQTTPSKPRGK